MRVSLSVSVIAPANLHDRNRHTRTKPSSRPVTSGMHSRRTATQTALDTRFETCRTRSESNPCFVETQPTYGVAPIETRWNRYRSVFLGYSDLGSHGSHMSA